MLGDVQLAEPGALIGFAGQRVIEQTIREKLPEGFQRAEYLLDHGMVDMVVPRDELQGRRSRSSSATSRRRGRRRRPDAGFRAVGRSGRPGPARPAGAPIAGLRPARPRPHHPVARPARTVRRIGCRRCSMSPAPTARARPAPSFAAALEASGTKVHLFTSPHLVRFNERIRIAGKLIEDDLLAALLSEVLDASDGIEASFFEITTAVAFLAFARAPADACVIEVGLGGRLDATNVIETPARLRDRGARHRPSAVPRREPVEIAARESRDRQARRPPGRPCLQHRRGRRSHRCACAEERGAPVLLEGRDWDIDPTLRSSLLGDHQVRNANLAWQMLRRRSSCRSAAHRSSADSRPRTGRRGSSNSPTVRLTHGVETWLDGAHNLEAARALAAPARRPRTETHRPRNSGQQGRRRDCRRTSRRTLCRSPSCRSATTSITIRKGLRTASAGRSAQSLQEALHDLPAPRLIAGSLYLAGEALKLNGQVPD